MQELQQKAEETELLQAELQMLETERVRLSLVEEKLLDVLQLLQHLRDLVSHSVTHTSITIISQSLFVRVARLVRNGKTEIVLRDTSETTERR